MNVNSTLMAAISETPQAIKEVHTLLTHNLVKDECIPHIPARTHHSQNQVQVLPLHRPFGLRHENL